MEDNAPYNTKAQPTDFNPPLGFINVLVHPKEDNDLTTATGLKLIDLGNRPESGTVIGVGPGLPATPMDGRVKKGTVLAFAKGGSRFPCKMEVPDPNKPDGFVLRDVEVARITQGEILYFKYVPKD